MKTLIIFVSWLLPFIGIHARMEEPHVALKEKTVSFGKDGHSILVQLDVSADESVYNAATILVSDLNKILGKNISSLSKPTAKCRYAIVAGSVDDSWIQSVLTTNKIDITAIEGQKETYLQTYIGNGIQGISHALLIVGSDARGSIYGMMDFVRQQGVSPWHWWADVPVKRKDYIEIDTRSQRIESPKVEYRGIFINDEAPALSQWSKNTFGGFNHHFYAKVFELMIRLKANYIWPAMWGNAFFDDDPENQKMAKKFGIIVGTSHHEPMMRAHVEWSRYYKNQPWNYQKNKSLLQEFWKSAIKRTTCEKLVTIGMRGDGDEPMTESTAIELLTNIVADQREIISEVSQQPAENTPQIWALYKEVQDYYDKGMTVPQDVTLLFCDDNWGNVRRLPELVSSRKGGYGMYYHFDYVGGPRNYKWINTNYLPRIWDQMHLSYEHGIDKVWIVNVGDIKPMELPVSFFLDMAWNPEKFSKGDIQAYIGEWAQENFETKDAETISNILFHGSRLLSIRKPELIHAQNFSYENGEWDALVIMYNLLEKKSSSIMNSIDSAYYPAYYQLVHHPIEAMSNLMRMYYHQAQNQYYYRLKNLKTNFHADKVLQYFKQDSLITEKYHHLLNRKWNHLMSQTHIGYTYWQQPEKNMEPHLFRLWKWESDSTYADFFKPTVFQVNTYTLTWPAAKIAEKSSAGRWEIIPYHSRFGHAYRYKPEREVNNGVEVGQVSFKVNCQSSDSFSYLHIHVAPGLDVYNKGGLKIGVRVNDGDTIQLAINAGGVQHPEWEKWVADNTIHRVIPFSNALHQGDHLQLFAFDRGIVWQSAYLSDQPYEISYFGESLPDVQEFLNLIGKVASPSEIQMNHKTNK